MKQNKKIAITGGIGSGKSEVAKIIAAQGLPVFSCDKIYAELLNDKSFLGKICGVFGHVLKDDGTLDRERLSEIVFNDAAARKRLNELTHPEIMRSVFCKMCEYPLSFCEVPLLFEGDYQDLFDNAIVVLRERERRVAAVLKRDNIDRNDVIQRINSQFDYDNCDFAKYYVIHNNGDLSHLRQKTLETLELIKNK